MKNKKEVFWGLFEYDSYKLKNHNLIVLCSTLQIAVDKALNCPSYYFITDIDLDNYIGAEQGFSKIYGTGLTTIILEVPEEEYLKIKWPKRSKTELLGPNQIT